MISSGANGYLLKSVTPQILHKAILDIHTKGYYYSSTAPEKTFKIVEQNLLPFLNEKEQQFLRLCSSELTYNEIADIMQRSVRTIEGYQESVSNKLNIHGRIGLALFAVHAGLVPINSQEK